MNAGNVAISRVLRDQHLIAHDHLILVGTFIRQYRELRNLSLTALAAAASIDRIKLHHLEHGRQIVADDELARVIDVLFPKDHSVESN